LPLDVEEVRHSEGQETQDCELRAAKRLVRRLRADHRQLAMGIVGDALYGHEPLIVELQRLRMRFVLVAKPSSHAALFAQGEEREQGGECVHGRWEEGTGRHRRTLADRSATDGPLTQAEAGRVNFLEVWEQRPDGTVGYHNSCVTDFAVTPQTVAPITGIGRSRWKIENEPFNVQKNHGYELGSNTCL
jgi:hypothetical protein